MYNRKARIDINSEIKTANYHLIKNYWSENLFNSNKQELSNKVKKKKQFWLFAFINGDNFEAHFPLVSHEVRDCFLSISTY